MELTGGNMSGAVRVGDTVHRAAGPWTPTVHRLLRHLRGSGVPEPIGVQDDREVVSFLPGTVPQNPMPAWVWTDGVLVDAGRRLAALHAVTVHFAPDGGGWQLAVHEPVEVVCHNDFAPYNLVFDDDRVLTGVIDWDTARAAAGAANVGPARAAVPPDPDGGRAAAVRSALSSAYGRRRS